MSFFSSSPYLPSDNESELSSSLNEDVSEIIEGGFMPCDKNSEPVATQKEATGYEENFAH